MSVYTMGLANYAKLIVGLLFRDNGIDYPFSPDFFQFADKNDLMLAVGKMIPSGFNIPEPYRTRYFHQLELHQRGHEICEKFIDRCADIGIPVFTIKSFLPFPYIDSNIDFVVMNSDLSIIQNNILNDLGFERLRSLADIREPNKQMYGRGKRGLKYPKLHLHTALSWNGITYLDKFTVWDRHRQISVNGLLVPIPSAEDELMIMAAHSVFENKYITLCELLHLFLLLESSLDWEYIKKTADENSWTEGLRLFLSVTSIIGEYLGFSSKINKDLMSAPNVRSIEFPVMLSMTDTLRATFSKFALDMRHSKLEVLPRELFSYIFVDLFWMYKKALKKVKAQG